MFVRTARGELVPLTVVERLWSTHGDGQSIEHGRLKDGTVEQLAPGEIARLNEADAHSFPAAPETYVLQEVLDEHDRMALERVLVLGWIVSPDRGVLPITIEGVNHGLEGTAAVLMPSGEVVLAMNCTYANEECYFADLRTSTKVSPT
jgi:hypothetical protein